jgi:oligopeptide transport system substrate-binding protein
MKHATESPDRVPALPRIAAGLACLVAAAGALSACGGPTPVEVATADKVFLVGNGAEPKELDPHLVSGVPEHRILTALFEGLVTLDPDTLEVLPGVAERWEVSDDQRVYTFHLRKDAKWSNGDAVTAQDFVYAWRRILSPALGSVYSYMLHVMVNAEAYNRGELDDFSQVGAKALDDRTLQVTLAHPTPYFLPMQVHYTWFPVHPPTIEAHGAIDEPYTGWTRPGNMVSNGPFRLEAWNPNVEVLVERNPHYWDAEAVKLNGVRFLPINDALTEERSFRNGELHRTETIPPSKVDVYQETNPDVLKIHPLNGTYFYRINTTRPPFTDARVRRALAMAIEREAIVTHITRRGEKPAFTLTPPGTGGYTFDGGVEQDPEAAARLFEGAIEAAGGWGAAEILFNTQDTHRIIAEAIQRMWKEAFGVNIGLFNQEWKVYLATMNQLDYDIARSAWIGDVLDPINFLECFTTGNGNNRTGWSNAEYDALIAEARAAVDEAAYHRLLAEAEAILLREMPIVPIYYYTQAYLLSPDVRGLGENPMGYVNYKAIDLVPAATDG